MGSGEPIPAHTRSPAVCVGLAVADDDDGMAAAILPLRRRFFLPFATILASGIVVYVWEYGTHCEVRGQWKVDSILRF